ncbi:MAG TPA: sigma-70 family RNA polymerase sigma factor [Pirellulales bacterium]|nr:sigma-70 family RNA polymerase sigma factor [Pirellulales bacterium]
MAWNQFVEVYSPLIYRFARRRGLQDADAADLMQNVLSAVAHGIRTFDYDVRRGLFRSWLFTIVRNQVASLHQRRQRHPEEQTAHDSAVVRSRAIEQPLAGAEHDEEETWQREYQRQLLDWGLDQVRGEFEEKTWRAFLLAAIEHRPARDVGMELGMTPGAVYIAKSRVLGRLKERIAGIDEQSAPKLEEPPHERYL